MQSARDSATNCPILLFKEHCKAFMDCQSSIEAEGMRCMATLLKTWCNSHIKKTVLQVTNLTFLKEDNLKTHFLQFSNSCSDFST